MSGDTTGPRRSSRYRFVWPILIVIAAGLAAYPWLRPAIEKLTSDSCHPGGEQNVKRVALTLCVNPAQWSEILTFEPGKTSFGIGSEKIYFDTFGQSDAIPLTDLPNVVLRYSTQYATNNEKLEVIKQWETTLGGRTWKVIEFASHTADLVVYYYSHPDFGSAELFFMSFKPNVARRDALAEPILKSIAFADSSKQPSAGA